MKILTILGSPRREGNTAIALGWMEDRLSAQGHRIDRADVIDYAVAGCDDCRKCKEPGNDLCAHDDGANALFRRMMQADLIILATPLYCWSFPAQLKALVDRMHCMTEGLTGRPEHRSRLEGKTLAMLLTAGGGFPKNIDLLTAGYENLSDSLKTRQVEPFIIPFVHDPAAMSEETRKHAEEIADAWTDAAAAAAG